MSIVKWIIRAIAAFFRGGPDNGAGDDSSVVASCGGGSF